MGEFIFDLEIRRMLGFGKFIDSKNIFCSQLNFVISQAQTRSLRGIWFHSSCGASESHVIVIRIGLLRCASHFNALYNFSTFRNLSFSICDVFASLLIFNFNRCRDCPDFSIGVSHMGQTNLMGGSFDFWSFIDSCRQGTQNKWPHFVAIKVLSNVALHREQSLPQSSITFILLN